MVITNMEYMDGYYQNEIHVSAWMVITFMKYLDGHFKNKVPGWFLLK